MLESYNAIILMIAVPLLYLITWILAKFKKIKLSSHRKLWNIILLASFLVSGILGVLLAVFVDLNISINWYREILWLHVEFGIVMGIIAIFHFFWHIKYYFKIFTKKENASQFRSTMNMKSWTIEKNK